jgi:molybdate transport system regulatory protein
MHLQPSCRQGELIALARRLACERFAPRADRHDCAASFPFDDPPYSASNASRTRRYGATEVATARLTLRVDLDEDRAIGPGKIRLLEAIRDTGSITKAGIALGMSYRRAWLLVDDMNNCFREPVIVAQTGGSHGGGTLLTPFGTRLIDQYRAIEAEAHSVTASRLRELEAACKGALETPAAKSRPAQRRRTIAR